MIQSNELRIGNKVQDGNGFIFDVVSIHYDDTVYCDFKGNEGGVWEFDKNSPCLGIALTEEILLKCGFKENKFSHVYEDDTRVSVYVNDDFFFCQINNVVINNIKYLHQLQNLYFALTNNELEINL